MSLLSESHRDLAINMINECLETAGSFGGKVFGGYVRDVIVPRLANRECSVKFNDVDVWFKTRQDSSNFIKAMGKSFVECAGESPSTYRFIRQQYLYYQHGTRVVFFDIIVSEELPVDDFDVNQLTYKLVNKEALVNYNYGDEFIPRNFSKKSMTNLKQAIYNKTATMLVEYIQQFALDDKIIYKSRIIEKYIDRIKRIYFERGWKVKVAIGRRNVIMVPLDVDLAWFKHNIIDCLQNNAKSVIAANSSTPNSKITDESEDKLKTRAEALEAFNAGLESMRMAFMKLLDIK